MRSIVTKVAKRPAFAGLFCYRSSACLLRYLRATRSICRGLSEPFLKPAITAICLPVSVAFFLSQILGDVLRGKLTPYDARIFFPDIISIRINPLRGSEGPNPSGLYLKVCISFSFLFFPVAQLIHQRLQTSYDP